MENLFFFVDGEVKGFLVDGRKGIIEEKENWNTKLEGTWSNVVSEWKTRSQWKGCSEEWQGCIWNGE